MRGDAAERQGAVRPVRGPSLVASQPLRPREPAAHEVRARVPGMAPGSMKAYLRMDPLTDERKAGYTDGQFRAFFNVLCAAGRQNPRGRFRSLAQLKGLLGVHARHVPFLISEGDIVPLEDGSVYVD